MKKNLKWGDNVCYYYRRGIHNDIFGLMLTPDVQAHTTKIKKKEQIQT